MAKVVSVRIMQREKASKIIEEQIAVYGRGREWLAENIGVNRAYISWAHHKNKIYSGESLSYKCPGHAIMKIIEWDERFKDAQKA